jgi:superoxide dismutase, Fe-Mn family
VSAVQSLGAAHLRQSPPRLIKSEFDLREVRGLSPRAIETHLCLYEGYVNAANELYEQLAEYPQAEALSPRERLERDGLVRRLSFEHNGALLHEAFFEGLGAGRGAPPVNGVFQEGLDASFGGFEAWKQDVIDIGQTRGVGWVITCRSSGDNRLFNVWIDDHTRGLLAGFEPVAVFDLWEHAYLLDFKPAQRADYLRVLMDNMNWDVVESRCV